MNPNREEIESVAEKARLYMKVGRLQTAENILRDAIAHYNQPANLENLLGNCLFQQQKHADAIESFQKATNDNPSYLEAQLNLTAALCQFDQYGHAEQLFSRIDDCPSNDPIPLEKGRIANQHVQCAELYERSRQWGDAKTELRKALELFSDMPDVQLKLAKLHYRLGEPTLARKQLEDLISKKPDLFEPRIWMGILSFEEGDKSQAFHHWTQASQLKPDHPLTRSYKALADSASWNKANHSS